MSASERAPITVAVVVGNPKPRSRTLHAACLVAERLADHPADLVVDLVELGPALLDWGSPEVARTVSAVAASDLAIFACPTYKGSYTGLLKLFLDRVGAGALAGLAAAVPLMLGGDLRHALAPEVFLKPVLNELGASCPTAGLFLLETGYQNGAALDQWVERARHLVGAGQGAVP